MTAGIEKTFRDTTPEKPAMPRGPIRGKTGCLNAPGIRWMDETHVRKGPSDPPDQEKTL
jgi:hypothetical protein